MLPITKLSKRERLAFFYFSIVRDLRGIERIVALKRAYKALFGVDSNIDKFYENPL